MGLYVGTRKVSSMQIGTRAAIRALMGDRTVWEPGGGGGVIEHATLAEYSLEELQMISADLTAKGEHSIYWETFRGFIGKTKDFGTFVVDSELDKGASVDVDKHVICVLIDICHDDLADGSGKAGLTFMTYRALPYAYSMGYGKAWASSPLRRQLNSGSIWDSMPESLRGAVKTVTKLTNSEGYTADPNAVTASSDAFWLLSWAEFGSKSTSNPINQANNQIILPLEGSKYAWYVLGYSMGGMQYTNSGRQPDRQGIRTGSLAMQTRSYNACYGGAANYLTIGYSGYPDTQQYDTAASILPAFCI